MTSGIDDLAFFALSLQIATASSACPNKNGVLITQDAVSLLARN